MEDIKIQRQTRANPIVVGQAATIGTTIQIPGRPDRIALIIDPRGSNNGSFYIAVRNGGTEFRLHRSVLPYGTLGYFSGTDGLGATTFQYMPVPGGKQILHIRDFGQLLLGDLIYYQESGSATVSITETYLLANESSDL